MNLAHHLHRNAAIDPDGRAIVLGTSLFATWGKMAARVARLAGGLRNRLGLDPGARAVIFMRNSPAYAELMFACWHAGVVAVPVNSKLHPRELAYILDHSGAGAAFASTDLAESLGQAAGECGITLPMLDVGSDQFRSIDGSDAIAVFDAAPDDLAWLFYTSGTTGRPKGAMLSHRNLRAMALSYFVNVDPPAPGGCLLHAAPMSHGSGLYMIPHVLQGNCQIMPESGTFSPDEFIAILAHAPNLSMFAAPTMVRRLVEAPATAAAHLDNLRTIVFGGAPMYVPDLKRAIAHLGYRLAQLYGQGESPMTITGMTRSMIEMAHRSNDEAHLGSVGVAQSVVEVRVADAQDRAVGSGQIGEVLVRGDAVMWGYWRAPEATAETLRGGWLHTGDVGRFDEAGYLTLMDRSKDLIISGGANIYPREVEEVLLLHRAVNEVAVVGRPSAEWGEEVVAFVVLAEGETVEASALDRLCLDNIARFKRPKEYRFVSSLPKNNYGKVLKTELRALADADREGPGVASRK